MIHKQRDIALQSLILGNGYLLDIEESPDTFAAWVYHEDVPIKKLVCNCYKSECKTLVDFMDKTLEILSASIKDYEDDFMEGDDEYAD